MIVAQSPNVEDFLGYMDELSESVKDIDTQVGEHDSIEVRQTLSKFLHLSVVKIRDIIRQRQEEYKPEPDTDDD